MRSLYELIWGWPLMTLVCGIGLYLTIALRCIQLTKLPYALRIISGAEAKGEGDISHFQSLMTALAATIGIGNIAGVATATVMGGPGALFWMWITAFLGMAIKYGEAFLAVKYRDIDANGEMVGGPMYFIEKGLGWKSLAIMFAFCGIMGTIGGGNMLQANSIADALYANFAMEPLWTGIALATVVGLTIVGGIRSIGAVAGVIVPFMGIVYIGGAVTVLAFHYQNIPGAFSEIFSHAFSLDKAAMGIAIQVGVSRGLMTSEAGLGTASIAAAAAKTECPKHQALVSMTGSFLATIILCTITALVLGVTGVTGATGVTLTMKAFQCSLGSWGCHIITFGVVFFGFTTLLGWAYYGEKCLEYLVGERSIPIYRALFTLIIIPGAILDLDLVWQISDIFNGLMAIPNLVGLLFLIPLVVQETTPS